MRTVRFEGWVEVDDITALSDVQHLIEESLLKFSDEHEVTVDQMRGKED